MSWIFFAILPRALWAINNVIDKTLVEKHVRSPYVFSFFEALLGILIVLSLVPFQGFSLPPIAFIFATLLGGALYTYGLIPYYQALSFEEASRVIPVWQVTSVFVLVLSALTIGETISTYDLIAFFLLLVGGILVSARNIEGKIKISKAFWLILASSAIFAISTVLLKYVYQHIRYFDAFLLIRMGGFLATLPLLLSAKTRHGITVTMRSTNSSIKGLFVANELINFLAIGSIEFAYVFGPASLISALNASQPVFLLILSVILSLWFPKILKEQVDKKTLTVKVLAIILIAFGIWILAF